MEDSHWNGCVDKKCYAGRGLAVPGCRCRMREVRVERVDVGAGGVLCRCEHNNIPYFHPSLFSSHYHHRSSLLF